VRRAFSSRRALLRDVAEKYVKNDEHAKEQNRLDQPGTGAGRHPEAGSVRLALSLARRTGLFGRGLSNARIEAFPARPAAPGLLGDGPVKDIGPSGAARWTGIGASTMGTGHAGG
jgi:hypothetical protein